MPSTSVRHLVLTTDSVPSYVRLLGEGRRDGPEQARRTGSPPAEFVVGPPGPRDVRGLNTSEQPGDSPPLAGDHILPLPCDLVVGHACSVPNCLLRAFPLRQAALG